MYFFQKIGELKLNLARYVFFSKDWRIETKSCKICIFHKNFAKVVLIAGILQDFCKKKCFSCELENACMIFTPQKNDCHGIILILVKILKSL